MNQQIPRNAAEAVANGAQWLDDNHPGWWREINLDILNLASCNKCVCGQLARTQYAQNKTVYLRLLKRFSSVHGFDVWENVEEFDELDVEWHKVITARLEADALTSTEKKEKVLAHV